MISYETYKILHLFTLLMTMAAMGAVIAEGRWVPIKSFRVVIGILSFLIFVGGMGLIARLGFKHGQSFPVWIYVKIGMWVVLNICLVMLFRIQQKSRKVLFTWIAFFAIFIAVYSAITKLV